MSTNGQRKPGTRLPAKRPVQNSGNPARRRSTKREGDPVTRQRVIDAAIKCILEQGFYRASSNAIAETAGLSWGVIQYYFGSRESLMLAVLQEGNRRLIDTLSTADLTGTTIAERLEQYSVIIERYYGDPEYLAFLQVLLNLSHDPKTSAQTRQSMIQDSDLIRAQLDRLTSQMFAGTGIRRAALRNFPFMVLRGLALSEVMLTTLPYDTAAIQRRIAEQRHMLAGAVAWLINNESATPTKTTARAR
jgi:TetR/AcrR family transcriptional regulator, regulator of cefoperazone and chloramphenicol sensitivity